jgi:hypothetical protein
MNMDLEDVKEELIAGPRAWATPRLAYHQLNSQVPKWQGVGLSSRRI